MIYYFESIHAITEKELNTLLSLLPEELQAYVCRYKQSDDRKRSALGWCLLSYGLKNEFSIDTLPMISRTAMGKPFFPEKNMPFFNLSHSGSVSGCALHTQEIGLDIQKQMPFRTALAKRICTVEEFSSLRSPQDLCRIWSQKESACKLTGDGITRKFSNFFLLHPEIHTYCHFLVNNAYCLSYSTYQEECLPLVPLSLSQLFSVLS